MSTTAIVVVGIIILAGIVIALIAASRSGRMRRPALKPLAPESRERYVSQWDRVESKFVDSPQEAVKEADALLLALLGEREHPLSDEKLPNEMRRARSEAVGREGGRPPPHRVGRPGGGDETLSGPVRSIDMPRAAVVPSEYLLAARSA